MTHSRALPPIRFCESTPFGNSNKGEVLIILLTHLGDVILNLFVLDAIAAWVAPGRFDVMVRPPLDQVVRSHPGVRNVMPFACPWKGARHWRYGLAEWFNTVRRLRLNRYDLIIVAHPHELTSLTARLSGSKLTAGLAFEGDFFLDLPFFIAKRYDRHASEYGLQLLKFLGVPPVEKLREFPVPRDDYERGRGLLENIKSHISNPRSKAVVIHPGAGGQRKIWPKESFVAVIDELLAQQHTVILLGGEIEKQICTDIEKVFSGLEMLRFKNLSGLLNIGELAGAISAADIYIGNDSGPSHIAGALGVRSCVIFGQASDPDIWSPKGRGVKVLRFEDRKFRSPESVSSVLEVVSDLMLSEQIETSV